MALPSVEEDCLLKTKQVPFLRMKILRHLRRWGRRIRGEGEREAAKGKLEKKPHPFQGGVKGDLRRVYAVRGEDNLEHFGNCQKERGRICLLSNANK